MSLPTLSPARRLGPALWLSLVATVLGAMLPASALGATTYSQQLYFPSGYERQVDGRTCTAAATAMMLNFIARRDLSLNQMTILRYEQPRDALNNSTQRGSDPLGWARALTYYAPRTGRTFTYEWEAYASESAALRRAAKQLAMTGKPVGLTTWHGQHAVVMTGFSATSDPRRGDFSLTWVWISDPTGSSHVRYSASDSPLDSYLETDATATYDRLWYGKYVIVVPQGSVAGVGAVSVSR
jgi:hypothetical protein